MAMATRLLSLSRTSLTNKHSLLAFLSRSYSAPSSSSTRSLSFLLRLRPLVAAPHFLPSPTAFRALSTRSTQSSLNDSSPNWSNRPPKETILLDGCDFEHWLVVLEKPDENATRDDIIQTYINTLAQIVGSEEEARMKIYSVSTKHYFAFGALVSEELSYKLKELPNVRWVLPDSYLDVKNKDYGGEPFINGEAVPYDPKYHEEWVRNNAKAQDRNRRNDRPRNNDRSRSFERRRPDGPPQQAGGFHPQGPPPPVGGFNNMGSAPNMGVNPNHSRGAPNAGWQSNAQNIQGSGGGFPHQHSQGPPPNYQGQQVGGFPPQHSQGPPPPNYQGQQDGRGGFPPQQHSQGPPPPNYQGQQDGRGGLPPQQHSQGPPPPNYQGQQDGRGGFPPQQHFQGPPPNYQNTQGPPPNYQNFGPNNNMGGPPGENQYQARQMHPPPPPPPRS